MNIGPYAIATPIILAPMAGVTDRPFRSLCRRLGAGMTVSEMVASNPALRDSRKSQLRLSHEGEDGLRSVQIVGGEPGMMADAARFNADAGAQIIDINMGCPAKKVCSKAAGSALMRDPELVRDILKAVVGAVDVPVTLKIRTGWSKDLKNGVAIARIAEGEGIAALAVHGRTRADAFEGEAEYETIAAIKSAVTIPVIANGDITGPEKAKFVLEKTGADAIMLGRSAQGRPWIFREIAHFLKTGAKLPPIAQAEALELMQGHMRDLYGFYGEFMGVRIARKHASWYLKEQEDAEGFRHHFNGLDDAKAQLQAVREYFAAQTQARLAH
ncbi:MAG: tRNA dihydrouridine synthase DusB [Gammaproteobacteria bacterium]|nr:tRNA dihydrouridine synthase DusB [Gammaproteobacteria bacterium]